MTLATACGSSGVAAAPLVTPRAAGQPAGSATVGVGRDVALVAQQVQEAITASGGTVTGVVDHAADAMAAGLAIPPSTVVIGGSPAGRLPLLRADQRAGVNLPERYLVHQADTGEVVVTYDGADYLTAVSGVMEPEAREALRAAAAPVVDMVAPDKALPTVVPLIGVTPAGYLLTVFGSADVPATLDRLRRGIGRGASRVVADLDLTAGAAADAGQAIRPTSVVLVSTPTIEAPLLAAAPSIGLDLPLRFVVWIDEQNRTQIGYPDVRRIAARHGVSADDPSIAQLAADADRLARLAAGISR